MTEQEYEELHRWSILTEPASPDLEARMTALRFKLLDMLGESTPYSLISAREKLLQMQSMATPLMQYQQQQGLLDSLSGSRGDLVILK